MGARNNFHIQSLLFECAKITLFTKRGCEKTSILRIKMLSLQAVLAVNALIVAILALILKSHYSHFKQYLL
ncbi:hypothetical protein I090019C5_12810 [Phocaeicola massiliensis]